MTVQELKQRLAEIEDDDLQVLICDLENDDEEAFHFEPIDSIEVVESKRRKWVSINFNK